MYRLKGDIGILYILFRFLDTSMISKADTRNRRNFYKYLIKLK